MAILRGIRKRITAVHNLDDAIAILYELQGNQAKLLRFCDYMFDEDARVADKAAWVLTNCTLGEIDILQQRQNDFINLALHTTNMRLLRLTMTLLERMMFSKDSLRTDFLDFCLDGMISKTLPCASQVLCMKLAYKQSVLYPEIKHEFDNILASMDIDYYQTGVKSIRKRIMSGKYK